MDQVLEKEFGEQDPGNSNILVVSDFFEGMGY
jgi:hypothetical protein